MTITKRLGLAAVWLVCSAPAAMGTATVAGVQFSRGPSDSSCTPPAAVTSFKTSDPEIWVWVAVNGAQANDVLKIDWVGPTGQIARSLTFLPLPSAGNWCFDDALSSTAQGYKPYTPAAGTWTARMTWNGVSLTSAQMTVTGASLTVRTAQLSKGPSATGCVLPAAVTSFKTTDTEIWANLLVDNALTNDVLKVDWLNPAGQVANTINFNPLANAGTWCFDSWLTKAADPHTVTAGAWTVRMTWNGNPLTSLPFSVTTSGGGTTPPTTLTVVLSPSTASNPVGTQHTVVAKVTDQNNTVQPNLAVTFTILSGPNAGAGGTCNPVSCRTDTSGQVSFTYTGSGGTGQDSIKACTAAASGSSPQACCSTPLTDAHAETAPEAEVQSPPAAKSGNVVIIGADKVDANCSSGANVIYNGGCLPITGKAGELGDFTFSGMAPSSVSAASLAAYDTAVLSVSSSGLACDTSKLPAQAKTDLIAFVGSGKKLIIYDSECTGSGGKGLDYSWLPYPFTTANPGAQGAQGTLNIVENSTLASSVAGSSSFVDATDLSNNTDAVGDMNVMTTKDSHWCLAMSGTNALKVTGPVLAYAKYPSGTDAGLFIYNGMDQDDNDNLGNANLRKIWVLELQQAFNPSNLPCGVAVVGISLAPSIATNPIGTQHTVTARVIDQTGKAQSGVAVTFAVSGTNAGATGTCSPGSCATDANGQVGFTYTGSKGVGQDSIQACFTPAGGTAVCSAPATKNWVQQGGTTQACSASVTKTWTAAGPACNYFVQPLTNLGVSASGTNNGFFQIFTGLSCKWGATSNDSWITIVAGASGSGSPGAVSYKVAANPASTPRTGTITITDGTHAVQTHTVTQLPGGPPCSYGVSPLFGSAPANGGGGGFLLTTVSTCFWLATPNDPWIHVTPSSGYGTLTVHYTADSNTGTSGRSGTIGVMGQTFTVYQGAPAPTVPAGTPVISDGGIVNSASSRAGPVARGSFFTIYGTNIGPTVPVQATTYPIPDTMGGVVVNISQGSVTKRAYLHFVSTTQINGIIPSDAPLGDVQVTVTFNGTLGVAATATLVDTSFGIFSAASGVGPGIIQNWNSPSDVVLNMPSIPAKQRQLMILWGTGLGPITTGDNNQPPGGNLPVPVQVEVAGMPVAASDLLYQGRSPGFAAVDNVYFYLPPGVPEGCSVPVRVKAGPTWSNTVRIAISSTANTCQDPVNPFSSVSSSGAKMGNIVLLRAGMSGQFQANQPAADVTLDVGAAVFTETKAGGQLAFSGALNLPPLGSCSSNTRAVDLTSILGGDLLGMDSTVNRQLDAGAKLTVTAPKGSVDLQPLGSNQGSYMGLLGGTVPLSNSPTMPMLLDPGASVSVTGSGGKDVGAVSVNVTIPNGITWTNRDQTNTVDRASPLTVTWKGGDTSQMLIIAGGAEDAKTKNAGGFYCLVPATAGTFNIPASILADVPATRPLTGGPDDTLGGIALISVPQGNPPKFSASGLDNGYVIFGTATLRTVQFK